MSFNGAWGLSPNNKHEWLFSYLSWFDRVWWAVVPGTVIKIKWPKRHGIVNSLDPTEHYGPWLNANVGKRGWNWNWKPVVENGKFDTNFILIKVRKPKDKLIPFFLLSIPTEYK